jgi:GNAT superfamily N-acetyltransferase
MAAKETTFVAPLSGERLRPFLPQLAGLRIEVFAEWPYLYEGTLAYEDGYLTRFAESPDHVAICAFDGDSLVGAATAAPLRYQHSEFTSPFIQAGFLVDDIFYFGESVLRRSYRGRGLGHQFFDGREAHADALGYTKTAFCAVIRPVDHPLRPTEYRPLDTFWRKRGYRPLAGIVAHFSWAEIGNKEETENALQFWGKGFE